MLLRRHSSGTDFFALIPGPPSITSQLSLSGGQGAGLVSSTKRSVRSPTADDLLPGRDFLLDGSGSFFERASTVLDVLWTRATCFGDGCRVVLTDSASRAGGAAYGGALAAWNQAMRYEGKVIYSLFQRQLGVFVPSFQRATQIEADFIFHRSFWLRNLTASPTAFSMLLSLLPPGLNFTSCYISDVKVSWAANPQSLWKLPITVNVESFVASAAEVPAGSEEEVEALITNWLAITNNQGQPCPFKGTYPLLDGATFRVAHVELNITSPKRYGNVSLSLRDLEVSAVDAKGQARDLDLLCKSGFRGDTLRMHRLVECTEASILRQPDDTEVHTADAALATHAETRDLSQGSTGGPRRNRRRGVIWRARLQRAWRRLHRGRMTPRPAPESMAIQHTEELAEVASSFTKRSPKRTLTHAEQDEKLKELLRQLPHPEDGLAQVNDDARVLRFTDWKASESLDKLDTSELQEQPREDEASTPQEPSSHAIAFGTLPPLAREVQDADVEVSGSDEVLDEEDSEELVNWQTSDAEETGGGFSVGGFIAQVTDASNHTNGIPVAEELANEEKDVQEDKGGFGFFHFHMQWPWSGDDDDDEVQMVEGGPPSIQDRRRRRSLWFWKHAEEHVDDEVEDEEDEEVDKQYVIAPTPVQVLVTQSLDVNDMRRNLEQRFDFAFPGPFSGIAAPPLLADGPELPPADPRLHPFPGPSPTWSFKVVKRNPLWGKPYKKPLYRRRRGAITMTALACLALAWLTTTWRWRPWVQTLLQRALLLAQSLPH